MAPIQRHVWPGCSTLSPFVVSDKALQVIEFAKTVFAAEFLEQPLIRSDGTLFHAFVKIGDTTIMFGDPRNPDQNRTAFLHVYVPDCDETFRKAVEAGASPMMAPEDQFYGDRAGGVTDLAGNVWWIATHVRTLPRAEVERLARDAPGGG